MTFAAEPEGRIETVKAGRILWWGRADNTYSRNRIVLQLLKELGWEIDFFRPVCSAAGHIEAWFHRFRKPDCIWVPCFRHTDIYSASVYAKKWKVPLIIDPLISAYEKDVHERCKWHPDSAAATARREWESRRLSAADVVVVDTPAHAAYFNSELKVRNERLKVLYVGAEPRLFEPRPMPSSGLPYEVLFYGSFIELHGPEIVVEAAAKTGHMNVRWSMLGEGKLFKETKKKAAGLKNIFFEPWVSYHELPDRIARAHILLGIFGTTKKAEMVIPNKVYQALSLGRPVITRSSDAYPSEFPASDAIGMIPAGDANALVNIVEKWLESPEKLEQRGKKSRKIYETFFSELQMKNMLEAILAAAFIREDKG